MSCGQENTMMSFTKTIIILVWSCCLEVKLCSGQTDNSTSVNSEIGSEGSYIGIVIGVAVAVVLLIIIPSLILYSKRRHIPVLRNWCNHHRNETESNYPVNASSFPIDTTLDVQEKEDSYANASNFPNCTTLDVQEKEDSNGKASSSSVVEMHAIQRKDDSKDEFDQKDLKEEIRIVLIGKTGSGKSATGNTILGLEKKDDPFVTSSSGSSITGHCSEKHRIRFNRKIVVVDTPGIFDTNTKNNLIQKEIFKCVALTSPGPHAFILVLNIARYTKEERESVEHFVRYFGECIYQYLIVLFTRKEDLDEDGKHLSDYLKTCPNDLVAFIDKCDGRVIAFSNRFVGEKQTAQVEELVSMILKNIERNKGECYRNELYIEAEKQIQKKEAEERAKLEEEKQNELKQLQINIARPLELKLSEEVMKRRETQKKIDEINIKMDKERKENNDKLQENMKRYQNLLKTSQGNEKREYQQKLDESNKKMEERIEEVTKNCNLEIKKNKETLAGNERKIEEIKKEKEELEKRLERLRREYQIKKENVRDNVRNEIEQEGDVLKDILNFLSLIAKTILAIVGL